MPKRSLNRKTLLFVLLACIAQLPGAAQQKDNLAALEKAFANPPDDCRIMVRWWWFGPAVTKPELQQELEQMKAEGIGGVEIATLYPLALDDPRTGFHNQSFLSNQHLDALRFAATTAGDLDYVLTSHWEADGHLAGRTSR